ncbi:MAG: hypothetical protein ILNGONEN_00951 [Syntrophorhabdaceae bacterium]|nr:hypothetical protein [Syntrophorhabdaceae bacterium]
MGYETALPRRIPEGIEATRELWSVTPSRLGRGAVAGGVVRHIDSSVQLSKTELERVGAVEVVVCGRMAS